MPIELSEDKIRSLLNSAQQQRRHWSTMIITLMGFVIVLNGGLWSYFLTEYIKGGGAQPTLVLIPSAVSATTFGLWRIYTRSLDKQIAYLYSELVYYEARLAVPHNFGISAYLTRSVPHIETILDSELEPEKKAKAIESLAKAKRIGSRGHARIEKWILNFIVLTLIGSIVALWRVYIYEKATLELPYLIVYIVCLAFIVLGIVLVVIALTYQRDPSPKLISAIMKEIQMP